MIGVLIRKQIREQFAFLQQGRNNKKRSKAGTIVLSAVLIISYLSLIMAGVGLSYLFEPLVEAGKDWLYFAMLGMSGLAFGIFGSVFVTYSTLYKAKDNDLLLAMPIPPWKILFARMATLYGSAILFELVTMGPALVLYLIWTGFSVAVLIQGILVILGTGLLIVGLSAILAFVVALVASWIRNKQIAITILTIVLLGGYYYVYFQMNSILQKLLGVSDEIGKALSKYVFPIYAMGRGETGEWLYTLAYLGIVGAFFAVVYFILSKTFIRITTISEKTAVKKLETHYEVGNVRTVLLKKELKHLTSSAAYMLNGAIGVLLLPGAAVAMLLNLDNIRVFLANLNMVGAYNGLPLMDLVLPVLGGLLIFTVSMLNLAAPSISIEGKHLWIVRSMPLASKEVIRAKLAMHFLLALPAILIFAVAAVITFGLDAAGIAVFLFFALALAMCYGYFSMMLGLKFPILQWDNEATAVKTGTAVVVAIFGTWGAAVVFMGIYALLLFVVHLYVPPMFYMLGFAVLFAVLAFVLRRWVYTKGAKILDTL